MSDRVDRALRALRERETGATSHAEETLQRVLADRLAAKRAWRRKARLWIPIAAVLAFSTLALARWGSMRTVHSRLAARDGAAQTHDDVALQPRSIDTPPPSDIPPVPSAAAAATDSVSTISVPPAAPPRSPPTSLLSTKRIVPAVVASAAAASSASASTSAEVPRVAAARAPSDETVYTRAHRLHFDGGDPAAALGAWDDYLLRFPDGRFTPDARYNRAIDLVKLHRYVEARAALQPFADGSFGGYHRDDARELLRSIP